MTKFVFQIWLETDVLKLELNRNYILDSRTFMFTERVKNIKHLKRKHLKHL